MRQQLLYKVGDLRLVETPRPEINADQVLVKLRVCAVCPTDVRKFQTGDHGVPHWPFNMGHEYTADIVEVGANVKGFQPGMRVAGGPYGGYADYMAISELHDIVPLPDSVSYEDGTFMEPFADCIHSVEQSKVRLGETLAVVGAGQMGLQHTIIGKLIGVKVIVTDVLQQRLDVAKRVGADYVIDASKEDPIARVKEITGGVGADGVCVTAGSGKAVEQALQMVKKTGAVVLFSGFRQGTTVTFDPNIIHYGEIVLTGSYWLGLPPRSEPALYHKALELIGTGKAPVGELISHRFPLEELGQALQAVGSYEALKAVIHIS